MPKKKTAKNDRQLTLALPDNPATRAVVVQLAKVDGATLDELTDHMERQSFVRVPRPWPYNVTPRDRKRWVASLETRQACRHAIRRGLITRSGRGKYRIRAAGVAAVNTKQAS